VTSLLYISSAASQVSLMAELKISSIVGDVKVANGRAFVSL